MTERLPIHLEQYREKNLYPVRQSKFHRVFTHMAEVPPTARRIGICDPARSCSPYTANFRVRGKICVRSVTRSFVWGSITRSLLIFGQTCMIRSAVSRATSEITR